MPLLKVKVTEKEAARCWFETHPAADYDTEETQTLGCEKHGFLPFWGPSGAFRAKPSIEKDGVFGEPARGEPDPECFDCMLAMAYQGKHIRTLCKAVGMLSDEVKRLKGMIGPCIRNAE